MTTVDTTDLDDALAETVAAAEATLDEHFSPRHRTAAAVRTATGTVATGLHLDTTISSESVHAEPVAVANAVAAESENGGDHGVDSRDDEEGDDEEGDDEADAAVEIVAVAAVSKQSADDAPVVIPPCGGCRELLADYASGAVVAVPGEDRPRGRPMAELLPSDVLEIADHSRFD